ncbi:hypothetical protein KFL_001460050 [Klebsormidium nitens]|uniref:Uncharacterized protein n=1 Tax=Klebsormidium nitens TaxID=105231 RepID=A0A1Y1I5I3_KLENI|nr:hypothetical protein KFL_001460050 [Klebsormidium nitens]|eukprot:GAQ83378.1 hypothetical protein KFL_001460050 [Klebsormidium nitens]
MAAAHQCAAVRQGPQLICSALTVAILFTSAVIAIEVQEAGSLTALVGSKAARQTYFEWNLGYALSNIQQYLGDKDPVTVLDWQKVYRQQATLNTAVLGRGGRASDGANGTLRYIIQGSLNGYAYRADTNATATMNKALPARLSGEPSYLGTGMMPIVCAQTRVEPAATKGGIECNVLLAQAVVKVGLPPANPADNASYSSAQLLDCGSQCQSFNDSFQLQSAATGIHFPLSYTQLYVEQAAQFSSLPIDTQSFIGEQNNPLSLENLQTTATLNAYAPLNNTPVCSGTTSVVPSLSSYILGGTTAFCARWNGFLVAFAWQGKLPEFNNMAEEDCAQLYREPYWGYLFSLGETRNFITSNNDPVCSAKSYTTTLASAAQNTFGMRYTVGYLSPESAAAIADLAYLHFSPQSMLQLDGLVHVANSTKIMADPRSGDACLLKQRDPSEGIVGDGTVNLGSDLVKSLLALAIQSAYASNQGSTIAAARAQIVALLSRFTLNSALSNAVASIAAGYGVNAFKSRLPFLSDNKSWVTIVVRLAGSLVEALSVNVATIAYLWGLVAHRYEHATASWVHTSLNQVAAYESFTLLASTKVTLTGQVQRFEIQVAIILAAILISSALVMYRWHFATQAAEDRKGSVFTGLGTGYL